MMQAMVEQVRKFLYGWMIEGAPGGGLTPGRVVSLYGLCFSGPESFKSGPVGVVDTCAHAEWEHLELLEGAIEDWAIKLNVNTQPVDDAHPDAPWGDNLVRKLMVIRGSGER